MRDEERQDTMRVQGGVHEVDIDTPPNLRNAKVAHKLRKHHGPP